MTEKKCKPILISGSNECEVWACKDCRTVHLHVGSISMRLRAEDFINTTNTLAQASKRLGHLQLKQKSLESLIPNKLHH